MTMKPWLKTILSILFIAGVGFLLFNLSFILISLVVRGTMWIMGQPANAVPHLAGRVLAIVLIFLISWLVLRSKAPTVLKATVLTQPLMTVIVGIGVVFSTQQKWTAIVAGALVISAVLVYLQMKKRSWMYSFATLYVGLLGLIIVLMDIPI